jgi:outer membrane protein assembly factor BamB
MQIAPQPDGSKGSSARMSARPGSDGNFGLITALDLQRRKVLWNERTRAPQTSALLATGGELVFNANLDRYFRALDARTGTELWRVRLGDVANAFPISYLAHGKQYVAVAAGGAKPSLGPKALVTPEVRLPVASDPTLWVFAISPSQ